MDSLRPTETAHIIEAEILRITPNQLTLINQSGMTGSERDEAISEAQALRLEIITSKEGCEAT